MTRRVPSAASAAVRLFAVARYLDAVGSPSADFLPHSRGEGFIRFFEERCAKTGIVLFDEPESALSPNRQFDFLRLLDRMEAGNRTEVLIVMACPGARLLRMSRHGLEPVALQDIEHFKSLREFVSDSDGMIRAMIAG